MPSQPPRKLLSFCTIGRNDDYVCDFSYRLTTSINYMAAKLAEIKRLDEVEFLVADWGSDPALQTAVRFSPEAARVTRFIHVPRERVMELQDGKTTFNSHKACNVALRRATGRFSVVTAADTFLPLCALSNLLKVLDGTSLSPFPLERTYFQIPRFHIPWSYVRRRPDVTRLDEIVSSRTTAFPFDDFLGSGGGAGMLLASWKLWSAMGGVIDDTPEWGYSDNEFLERVARWCSHVDTMGIGVISFHLEHPPDSKSLRIASSVLGDASRCVPVKSLDWQLGDRPQWGLPEESFQVQVALEEERGNGIQAWADERLKPPDMAMVLRLGAPEARLGVVRALERWVKCGEMRQSLRDADGGLRDKHAMFFTAWYSMHFMPARYLELGFEVQTAAVLQSVGAGSTEIYAGIQQEGDVAVRQSWFMQALLLVRLGHRGYLRPVNGKLDTAIPRLCASMIGPATFDLVLLRQSMARENSSTLALQAWERLEEMGALVVCGEDQGAFASLLSELHDRLAGASWVRARGGLAATALKSPIQTSEGMRLVDETLDFGDNLEWREISPTPWDRLVTAVNPRRWLRYLKRRLGR
jgi:hypothetical protein